MAEMCCGVGSEGAGEAPSTACESSSRVARRRRMEIRRFKFVIGVAQPEAAATATAVLVEEEKSVKRPKVEVYAASSFSLGRESAVGNCVSDDGGENSVKVENGRSETKGGIMRSHSSPSGLIPRLNPEINLKFGFTSLCGRRRDMEDAVTIHPSFHRQGHDTGAITQLHYFGVYDGHGCSHVAMRCRERLHELVKEELGGDGECEWRTTLERSFTRMDKEVINWNESVVGASCRCELQSPKCDAVGSTAVVAIVTPDKIVVANCGDSRAVLCRKGKAVPLSSDHKPDRPDELDRIQAAGGRVIYWDAPRVLGVLAMSRAIGDNYLKPYVSCEPEVTITDRRPEDDCLILASDGLWDVVSNETACGVARMCLKKGKGKGKGGEKKLQAPSSGLVEEAPESSGRTGEISDKACTDASMLLTKLALARHSTDNVSVVVVDLRKAT